MPAEVAFHFNAPDRVGYACRLLRKAYLKGARLWVRVPADDPVYARHLLGNLVDPVGEIVRRSHPFQSHVGGHHHRVRSRVQATGALVRLVGQCWGTRRVRPLAGRIS